MLCQMPIVAVYVAMPRLTIYPSQTSLVVYTFVSQDGPQQCPVLMIIAEVLCAMFLRMSWNGVSPQEEWNTIPRGATE